MSAAILTELARIRKAQDEQQTILNTLQSSIARVEKELRRPRERGNNYGDNS